jgi:hypothetical protein
MSVGHLIIIILRAVAEEVVIDDSDISDALKPNTATAEILDGVVGYGRGRMVSNPDTEPPV